MKEIKAVIRPFKLLDVVAELRKIPNLPGVTISDIREFGKSRPEYGRKDLLNGLVDFVHKVKIEVVVPDDMVDAVVETIQAHAHTGNPGDGKIFVYSVDDIIKIRTNERGVQAI